MIDFIVDRHIIHQIKAIQITIIICQLSVEQLVIPTTLRNVPEQGLLSSKSLKNFDDFGS